MSINSIRLSRDDLQKIIDLVDQLNDGMGDSVTIISDNSSGIGQVIEIECPIVYNGIQGVFRKTIVDESSW